MDAGNEIGDAGMASLAPALERMPQLTSLDLSCARIGIGRGVERLGLASAWICAVVVGWPERLRAGFCGQRLATCARRGGAWM